MVNTEKESLFKTAPVQRDAFEGSSTPQPGLGSGSSPPVSGKTSQTVLHGQFHTQLPVSSNTPKFGSAAPLGFSNIIGGNAISQFTTDTMGVWAPKMPLIRSKAQFFEETFLEFVEDAAFYFTAPVAGFALAKGFKKAFNLTLAERDSIGTKLTEKTAETIAPKVLAAKAGTIVGALAIASGFEYMIQHTKNVITAKSFKTKNFTAVAGLEAAEYKAAKGEMDPVDKAKKRAIQVGVATATVLGAAALAPMYLAKHPAGFLAASSKKMLQYVDFGGKFDINKPIVAILAGVGAVSYIDAARDSLERKETGTRLAVVIPYMLFGKEIAGWGLSNYQNAFGKVTSKVKNAKGEMEEVTHKIADLRKDFKFSFRKQEKDGTHIKPFAQAGKAESFLNMGVLRDSLNEKFEEIAKAYPEKGPAVFNTSLQEALINRNFKMSIYSYVISAAIAGMGINAIAYAQTRKRHAKQKLAEAQMTFPIAQSVPEPIGLQAGVPKPMPANAALQGLSFPPAFASGGQRPGYQAPTSGYVTLTQQPTYRSQPLSLR